MHSYLSRRPYRAVMFAAAVFATVATVPAGPAHAQDGCLVVDYQTTHWQTGPDTGGFTVTVTLTNVCDTPVPGWLLELTLAPGHTVNQGWSAQWTMSGNQLTAEPTAWNSLIPPGGSVSIGFVGSWTGSFQDPTGCTINGAPCAGDGQPPQATLTSPGHGAG